MELELEEVRVERSRAVEQSGDVQNRLIGNQPKESSALSELNAPAVNLASAETKLISDYKPLDLNSADKELVEILKDRDRRAEFLDPEKVSENRLGRMAARVSNWLLRLTPAALGVSVVAASTAVGFAISRAFNLPLTTDAGVAPIMISSLIGMIGGVGLFAFVETDFHFANERDPIDGTAKISLPVIKARRRLKEKEKDPFLRRLEECDRVLKNELELIKRADGSQIDIVKASAAIEAAQVEVAAVRGIRTLGYDKKATRELFSKIVEVAAERSISKEFADKAQEFLSAATSSYNLISPERLNFLSRYFEMSHDQLAVVQAASDVIQRFPDDRQNFLTFLSLNIFSVQALDTEIDNAKLLLKIAKKDKSENHNFERTLTEIEDSIENLRKIETHLSEKQYSSLNPKDRPFVLSASQKEEIQAIRDEFKELLESLPSRERRMGDSAAERVIQIRDIENALAVLDDAALSLIKDEPRSLPTEWKNEVRAAMHTLTIVSASWDAGSTYALNLKARVRDLDAECESWKKAFSTYVYARDFDPNAAQIIARLERYTEESKAAAELNTAPASDNFRDIESFRQTVQKYLEAVAETPRFAFCLGWSQVEVRRIEGLLESTENLPAQLAAIRAAAHVAGWTD